VRVAKRHRKAKEEDVDGGQEDEDKGSDGDTEEEEEGEYEEGSGDEGSEAEAGDDDGKLDDYVKPQKKTVRYANRTTDDDGNIAPLLHARLRKAAKKGKTAKKAPILLVEAGKPCESCVIMNDICLVPADEGVHRSCSKCHHL